MSVWEDVVSDGAYRDRPATPPDAAPASWGLGLTQLSDPAHLRADRSPPGIVPLARAGNLLPSCPPGPVGSAEQYAGREPLQRTRSWPDCCPHRR